MPVISALVLTNQNPVVAYTASVVTSGSVIADGLGNQIQFLDVSCSYAQTASVQTSWEMSSSYASSSTWANSSSFASESLSSYFASSSVWATSASYASKSFSSSYAPTITVGLTSTQSWVDVGTALTQSMYLSNGLVVSWSYQP